MKRSGPRRSKKAPRDDAGTDVERLIGEMREANERLIVAASHEQDLSDEAHAETARAQTQLHDLMREMSDAHTRLAAAAVRARTMAEEAALRQEEYRQLSGRLLTLQDEERRRLALDLHDSTAQRLAALIINLDVLEGSGTALDARLRRTLAESRSLAEQCAREIRTLAYLLHPPLLDEAGLVPAVRWLAEGFQERSGIRVAMDLDTVGRLPRPVETALFRVVQEGLTNAHRHAATRTVSIRLTGAADDVALEIQDEGHGLQNRRSPQSGRSASAHLGVGLQGMRERIGQLNGTFDVAFTNAGTTVRVRVPLSTNTP